MLPFETINEEKKATDGNYCSPVYIYGLVNSITNKIFYVGKSQTPLLRRSIHIYNAKGSCDSDKCIAIKEIFANSGGVNLIILEEIPYLSFNLHLLREKWWIAFLMKNGEPLTNIRSVKNLNLN